MSKFQLANPLIVGLDVDSNVDALEIARELHGKVGAFKIGPRLAVRYGSLFLHEIAACGALFLDNKYFDIPSTMEAAIHASFEAGATMSTVHALAGPEALARLAKVEAELNKQRPFKILAVTVLTSFNQETLPPGLRGREIPALVRELALGAKAAGLSGFVCSPQEAPALRRELGPEAFLVTPGVRLPDADKGDQKRVETPQDAMKNGASALVVARPICEAKNRLQATERYLSAIAEAGSV